MIPLRTGNMGAPRIRAICRGKAAPDPESDRSLLVEWRRLGFDEAEDYIGWAVVEPEPNRWDWSFHLENALAARRAGLAYVAYPWAHAMPAWFQATDTFVPGHCVEHGLPGIAPSIFAPQTWDFLERFYRTLHGALGDLLDGIVMGYPTDYGEIGCGSGLADWVLVRDRESLHSHAGYWCDEPAARQTFEDWVRKRYRTPEALSSAWGLGTELAWSTPYPSSNANTTHRMDFAEFYRNSVTNFTARLLALCEELFPNVPRELKLGHFSEDLRLGTDYEAIVRLANQHDTIVRSTHSALPEFFTKRVASLCRQHDARFATEPPRELPVEGLRQRLFFDAAHAPVAYFDFSEQWSAVQDDMRRLFPAFEGGEPLYQTACYYPRLDLDLIPGRGLPDRLYHSFAALRQSSDFEILDDRQIVPEQLSGMRSVVWIDGTYTRQATLAALEAWVERGGVFIFGSTEAPELIDADPQDPSGRRLLEAMMPDPSLQYGSVLKHAAGEIRIRPGDESHLVYLGIGWGFREDGAAFWNDADAAIAARWAQPTANLLVPWPPEESRLQVRAYSPERATVEVLIDGNVMGAATFQGPGVLNARIPGSPQALAPLQIRTTLRTGDHALLVRSVALTSDGASDQPPQRKTRTAPVISDKLRVEGQPVRIGQGFVLRGDGSPLSAIAWQRSWMAGVIANLPPLDPPRDTAHECYVTQLARGILVHNPDPIQSFRPSLAGTDAKLEPPELAPLETRWIDSTACQTEA